MVDFPCEKRAHFTCNKNRKTKYLIVQKIDSKMCEGFALNEMSFRLLVNADKIKDVVIITVIKLSYIQWDKILVIYSEEGVSQGYC